MAKIVKFVDLVDAANGKVCQDSNLSFVYSKRTGKCHTMRRHPENYNIVSTPEQQAHRLAFGAQAKTASAWIKANTTYDEKGKPSSRTADYLLMKRAYDQQKDINGFLAFVRAQIDPESGEIVVPGKVGA